MLREYRKTTTIKAEQFTEEPEQVFKYGMFPDIDNRTNEFQYFLSTKEGNMRINLGDWIATGEKGEHWAIKDDIFKRTYELVEDQEMKKEEKSCIVRKRGNRMTAKEKIVELLSLYDYPIAVIDDIRGRVGDFYLSGNSSDDNDPYLWQQVRYLENFKKFVLGVE